MKTLSFLIQLKRSNVCETFLENNLAKNPQTHKQTKTTNNHKPTRPRTTTQDHTKPHKTTQNQHQQTETVPQESFDFFRLLSASLSTKICAKHHGAPTKRNQVQPATDI